MREREFCFPGHATLVQLEGLWFGNKEGCSPGGACTQGAVDRGIG